MLDSATRGRSSLFRGNLQTRAMGRAPDVPAHDLDSCRAAASARITREMDEQTKDLSDYLAGFRRRKKMIFAVAAIVFMISAAVAALLPASYRSAATILIEQQEMPPDL